MQADQEDFRAIHLPWFYKRKSVKQKSAMDNEGQLEWSACNVVAHLFIIDTDRYLGMPQI